MLRKQQHCGKVGYQVVVTMGGKILRGTIDLETKDGVCLLAVFLPGEGITLAQIAIENQQNEVSAAPILLGWIDLRNKVVIGKAGANFLWIVKGNQPQLLQDLEDWFDDGIPLLPGKGCPPKDFRSAMLTNTRDVTLHEDQTRFQKHTAAHNMAIINNLSLSLIARLGFPFVHAARRFFAGHPDQALALLL